MASYPTKIPWNSSKDGSYQKYARAGIPVYWIVNLQERRIEVYTDPSGPAEVPDYRQHEDHAVGTELSLMAAKMPSSWRRSGD